jgi:hypothetical protein
VITPLQGFEVPTYGPQTFNQIANLAGQLEAIAVPRFASEITRDQTIVSPTEGQCAHVAGLGLSVYDGTGWRYLAWRDETATPAS